MLESRLPPGAWGEQWSPMTRPLRPLPKCRWPEARELVSVCLSRPKMPILGVVAQDLLKKSLPFLNISGKQVPWGNVERNAEVTKLMAGHRWYGPGSHFVNLAPDDVR